MLNDLMTSYHSFMSLTPFPNFIYAHPLVPRGTAWKQWLTNGHLVVWMNTAEIYEFPRFPDSDAYRPGDESSYGQLGIPVIKQ